MCYHLKTRYGGTEAVIDDNCGISKFYMPKMFGGGAKAATPYFEKAQELFSKETRTAMNEPHWGQPANNYFLEQVKSGDKE